VWLGHYEEGIPRGICWQSVLGSAWLVGHLDSVGQMTGSDVAFLYPDLSTALVGQFENGKLVSAFHSKVISFRENSGLFIPSFEKVSVTEFRSVNNNTFL
jgi:histone-lysine N-methyltransferase SETD7